MSTEIAQAPVDHSTIILELINYQLSLSESDRIADQVFQQLAEKVSLDAVGKATALAINSILTIDSKTSHEEAKSKLLAITKFPTLCAGILKHYQVKDFSDLCTRPFYQSLRENFQDTLAEFDTQFEQAINMYRSQEPTVQVRFPATALSAISSNTKLLQN